MMEMIAAAENTKIDETANKENLKKARPLHVIENVVKVVETKQVLMIGRPSLEDWDLL
jgi:hypothetical protein